MASQRGVADNTYVVTASFPILVSVGGPGNMYAGMDLTSYVQFPTDVNVDSFHAAPAAVAARAVSVNANGSSLIVTGSFDQGIFRWDSTTNGAWTYFGNISIGDWVLTDTFNASYGDYFWQVTKVQVPSYTGNFYEPKVNTVAPPAAAYRNVLCSINPTGPKLAIRSY